MEQQQSHNEAELCGTVAAAPVFSHEKHGTRFFTFPLRVLRLSGQADVLPVLASEALARDILPEETVRIRGQLRSFNNKSGQGRRLVLAVYTTAVEPWQGKAVNRILLRGALCKPPTLRCTPLGRSICDVMLAVSRRYGRADYLPVIVWGQLAQRVSRLTVGSPLAVQGRFQSRPYTKVTEDGPVQHVAYEVSVMNLLDT